MAFAKQYYSSYKSSNNLEYYLEIFVDGYTGGNPSEITLGAGGPVITYETDQEDRFSPILSSQCVLPFMVQGTGTQSFIQLLRTTYQERQVYLHLYRANSSGYSSVKPIWSGFLVMDLGAGEDVSFPYEQKLTFVDGLSLLKDIDFVDLSNSGSETNIMGSYTQDNMYFGPATYIYWIREILGKAGFATTSQGVSIDWGFTTAINWYNETMTSTSQSSDPLALTQCIVSMFHTKNDQDVYTPENCYTVLKQLLRHWGARITYWKHELWIVQIPEYIQDEAGLIDNPDNINSRQYNRFGAYQGSQDHLGDTYYTRYEQTIANNQVSKLVGTKYNYLPIIHRVSADFLSFAGKNYYGGFPYGTNATSQEIFQSTIIDPSSANFIWLSIPLNWVWDMSQAGSGNYNLSNGHTNGWWCSIKFNFYASDGTTTYYLQYDSSTGAYYWVLEADWSPLGNTSPRYVVKSRNLTETNYIGFQEQLSFVDSSGSAITMNGAWSFFLDIEDYGTSGSNPGSFYCNFSGYNGYGTPTKMRNPNNNITIVSPLGVPIKSGTVSWSNTLQDPTAIAVPSTILNPAGFNAGTNQDDIRLATLSSFKGFLQTLNVTQNATFGQSVNTQINNNSNTEIYSFGTLLWGDAVQQFAVGGLRVNNGSSFVKTDPDGKWGRGTLTGTQTFTELLIDEFMTGQVKVAIAPTMRLAVGELNKNQTATGQSGSATRPRYVNPIGRLRESRSQQIDPEYIFRRGSFYTLYDEWDYEGYQILRDTPTTTTTTTNMGGLGGGQIDNPLGNAKIQGPVTNALMMNSPVAYVRATVPATGSDVAVNGNFNVATGWTLGAGWSIDTTAKKASFTATGSTSDLTQSVLTQGLTYQINFTVVVSAGSLLVKAGSSGTTETITTSGDYSIYLNCEGSNLIKFQAGTTFTGTIKHITARDQKSLSSLPINVIGNTVFKTGDTFNIVNSIGDEIIPLTVTSNQGASDDTISVTAVPLYDDIAENSVLLINQDDLSEQYQNKTKGTVAGFTIDADGIAKGGVEITGWLDSDTMSGATANNVPTAESVKAYVDAQVGTADTLEEVTANGNSTSYGISFTSTNFSIGSAKIGLHSNNLIYLRGGSAGLMLQNGDGVAAHQLTQSGNHIFEANGEKMRLTTGGNLGIGTSSPQKKLDIASGDIRLDNSKGIYFSTLDSNIGRVKIIGDESSDFIHMSVDNSNSHVIRLNTTGVGIGTTSPNSKLQINVGTDQNIGFNSSSNLARISSYNDAFSASSPLLINGSDIRFTISTTEKMRLTSTGLGIGTTNASSALDVVGNADVGVIQVSHTTNGCYGSILFGTISRLTGDCGTWNFKNTNTNTTQLYINDTGVGIGTTSPSNKLHVVSGDNVATTKIISAYSLSGTQHTFLGYNSLVGSHSLDITTLATQPIAFNTNNSEKMRLTSDGDLALGLTSASKRLHVYDTTSGIARLETNQTYSDVELKTNNGTAYVSARDGHVLLNRTGGNNVGINTDSPTEKLHVVGKGIFTDQVTIPATPVAATDAASKSYVDAQVGSADTLQEVTDNGNTTTNSIRIGSSSAPAGGVGLHVDTEIRVDGNDGVATRKIRSSYFSSAQNITIESGSSAAIVHNIGSSEKMRLTSTGLGIGTTSPEALVTIKGDAITTSQPVRITNSVQDTHTALFINNIGGTIGEKYGLQFGGYNEYSIGGIFGVLDSTSGSTSGDITIDFPDGTSAGSLIEKVRFTHEGNVGIGTASPAYKLDLVGGNMQISNGGATWFGSDSTGGFVRTFNGNTFRFLDSGGGETMRINNSTSKVGIGTTSPNVPLEVNGNARFGDSSTGIAFGIVSTDVYQISGADTGFSGWNSLHFKADSNDGLFLQKDTNNVGIGTSSPARTLDVVGRGRFVDSNSTVDILPSNFTPLVITNSNGYAHARINGFEVGGNTTATSEGYIKTQDNSRKLFLDTNGWRFVENNNELARITSGGNLLIGQTSEDTSGDYILQVHGDILVQNNKGIYVDNNTNYLRLGNKNSGIIELGGDTTNSVVKSRFNNLQLLTTRTADDIIFTAHNTEVMRIDAGTSNVLIGTTSDFGAKLNVNGNTSIISGAGTPATNRALNVHASSSSMVADFRSASGNNSFVSFSNNASTADQVRIGSSSGNAVISTNYTERMRLTSGGNVLIGTTTDSGAKLQLKKADSGDFISFDRAGTEIATVKATSTYLSVNAAANKTIFFNDAQLDVDFRINTDNTDKVFFVEGSSGNVGIGTTSPDQMLHISGLFPRIKLQDTDATNTADNSLIEQNDGILRFRNDPNFLSNNSAIQFDIRGSEKARITSSGNLLIGTTTDDGSSKLQVAGDVKFYGDTSSRDMLWDASQDRLEFQDNVKAVFGTDADLHIYNDGTNSVIATQNTSGNLIITQNVDNANLVLKCDDGLGGQTAYLTLDGSQETVNVSQNLLINTTTDVGVPLYVNGVIRAVGGGIQAAQDYGFTLNDEAGNNRYGLKFGAAGTVGGSDLLMLTNRSIYSAATSGGIVTIGGNSSTTGVSEVEIARFDPRVTATSGTQKKVTLDAVLELTAQTDPANPANNKSIIWMDTNGNIKAKMTDSGGTTVTRTIAAFEG